MNKRVLAVIVASFSTIFVAYAIRYGYGVILPEMLPSLAISKTEAGVIFSSYFVAYTVFSPVLGLLSDRYDVRVILTLFPAILGIGTFLMSRSLSLFNASFFFALAGIGAAACWAPVMALAQRWVSEKRRGSSLAFIDIGSALGITACSAFVPLVVVAHGWRMGWMSLSILAFVIAGANFFLIRSYPEEKLEHRYRMPKKHAREPIALTYISLLRDLKFWLLALSYLFIGFSILIPFTFVSTYAVQELTLSYEIAARLVTVMGVTAIVGKLVLGPVSDIIGRIKVMMLCAALVAMGCLGIAYSERLLTLILSTVTFGFGYGAIWSMYAASASDYFSKESAGTIVGLWVLYFGIGSILSPIIAGWIGDITGTLSYSFILAMAAAVIALFFLALVWRASSSFPGRNHLL